MKKNPYDPNEPRTQTINGKTKAHKTIGLQFNRHEWWALEQAVKKSKRSVNSIIREGIKKELNSLGDDSEICNIETNISEVISSLPEHMFQGRRILEFLSKNLRATSREIKLNCSVKNVSDCARHLNHKLEKFNLMVACEHCGPIKTKNKNDFLWSICEI